MGNIVTTTLLRFGPFTLHRDQRKLTKELKTVELSSRAFDILSLLATHAGNVIDKRTLVRAAWPDTVVEDSNLRVHIASLRKTLHQYHPDNHYIENVPGRGYCFTARVSYEDEQTAPPIELSQVQIANLSRAKSSVVGRHRERQEVAGLLSRRKLVTLCGPGGIGKTTLALTVAEHSVHRYQDGIRMIDFAQLSDPDLCIAHMASVMQIPVTENQELKGLLNYFRERNVLLILDNCERHLECLSVVVEALQASAPQTGLLATSREPLRACGEQVYPLSTLACPPISVNNNVATAMSFPAARLFVERARAVLPDYALESQDCIHLATICQRLDGLPLAIELAAARIQLFSLPQLAGMLDDRFNVLNKGRRTALHRHQTLRAMIDWSYETLTEREAWCWRQLGVFGGGFGIDAARAIFETDKVSTSELLDMLDVLVSKSLITVKNQGPHIQFCLLESMRYYALGHLSTQEFQQARHRHCQYFLNRCQCPPESWDREPDELSLLQHRCDIIDIRLALNWAFSEPTKNVLAVRLTVTSAPIWFRLLLLPELRHYLELCHQFVSKNPHNLSPQHSAQLYLALGHTLFHTQGPGPNVREALSHGLPFAKQLSAPALELQLVWALYAHAVTCGEYEQVTHWTERYAALYHQAPDPMAEATLLRAQSIDFHLQGKHAQAVHSAKQAILHPAVARLPKPTHIFFYDHRVATSAHFARALWVKGYPQSAWQVCEEAMQLALEINQPFALGYFLVCGACPVALWNGDRVLAEQYITKLEELGGGVAANVWQTGGQIFRCALESLQSEQRVLKRPDCTLTRFYADTLVTIDWHFLKYLPECQTSAESRNWCTPETLRARGEMILHRADGNPLEAMDLLRKAYQLAKDTGALSWQIRAAISLMHHQAPEAPAALELSLNQCSEGCACRDWQEGMQLLG